MLYTFILLAIYLIEISIIKLFKFFDVDIIAAAGGVKMIDNSIDVSNCVRKIIKLVIKMLLLFIYKGN